LRTASPDDRAMFLSKLRGPVPGLQEDRRSSKDRILKLGAIAWALGSLAIGIGACHTSVKTMRLLTSGVVAQGTIVGFQTGLHQDNRGPGPNDRRTFMPIIEFTPAGGRPVRFVSGSGTSLGLASGMSVRYNPEDPAEAEVDSWGHLLFLLVWPWLMAAACAGAAVLFWRVVPRLLKGS
jgi:hypothetical protein